MKLKLIITFLALLLFSGVASATETPWEGLDPNLSTGTVINGVLVVAPTASISTGTYQASQTVSLSAPEANSIRYTLTGSEPSCSSGTRISGDSGSITINSSLTLKAISCYKSDDSVSSEVSEYSYTFTCPTVDHAATYNAYPTCGPATCSSGYVLSGGVCVASNSGGGGGGGSIRSLVSEYCTSVTYGDWQKACFNGIQYRSVVAQSPAGCSLTSAQQLAAQRSCQVTSTTTQSIGSVVSEESVTVNNKISNQVSQFVDALKNIANESQIVSTNNKENLLNHLGGSAELVKEVANTTKYQAISSLDKKINAVEKSTIDNFMIYGTQSTQRLGSGERAAVVNSYYQAYKKLPKTETEWADTLKIANGRWPSERNMTAENQAKLEFRKVYLRDAVLTNNKDENAIMVMAYGLLPPSRNLDSEKAAIKTFRYVYGHSPVNALAWNIVRAIAYSGTKR